jgi:two-component system OmpR family sensor kinase
MLDSVRTRLTLWYVSVLALVLVAFSLGVYFLLARSLYERLDGGLRATLDAMVVSMEREIAEPESPQQAAVSTVEELFYPRLALAVFDTEGHLMAERPSQDGYRAQLLAPALIPGQAVYLYTEPEVRNEDGIRVGVQRVRVAPSGPAYIIAVGQSLETVTEQLELLRHIFAIAVPAVLVLAGIGGWFLARKSLAPVVAMSDRARQLGAENLDERLPVSNPRDELGRLACAFNELLARLEAAFALQRQFMADASHELRTPLGVIQTAAGVTLERERRGEGEYREALKLINEQARRLTRVVEDMFMLARADAGRHPLHRSQFYLDELLGETARAAAVLAVRKGVEIEMTGLPETLYEGDEDLLRRMVLNLLDNAIKHTPAGGEVRLSLRLEEAKYLITVTDTGGGIPPEAQPNIFERFYRADKARARAQAGNGSGAGLGLAISRWIAEAHEGDLDLERSDETGSTFVASLPARNKA